MATGSKPRVCIVTKAKDEGPYILEWVAYHLSIGVDHFFFVINDCSDHTHDLLTALEQQGVVTFSDISQLDLPGRVHNDRAYGHAKAQGFGQGYDWVFTIDVDEFIYLPRDRSVSEFLARHPGYDCFEMVWTTIGPSGQLEREPATPVLRSFARLIPAEDDGKNVKALARVSRTIAYTAHRPKLEPDAVSVKCANLRKPAWATRKPEIHCLHFYTKSYAEWALKSRRGSASTRDTDYIGSVAMDYDQGREYLGLKNGLLDRMDTHCQELLGSESVSQAHRKNLAWLGAQTADLHERSPVYHFARQVVRDGVERVRAAEVTCERFRDSSLAHWQLFTELARVSGHEQRALSIGQRATELRPQPSATSLMSLGLVAKRTGDFDYAGYILEQARKVSPGNMLVRTHLADVYEQCGKLELAEKEYREVLRRRPNWARERKRLAKVQARQSSAG